MSDIQSFAEQLAHALAHCGVRPTYDRNCKEFTFKGEGFELAMDEILEHWVIVRASLGRLDDNELTADSEAYLESISFCLSWFDEGIPEEGGE